MVYRLPDSAHVRRHHGFPREHRLDAHEAACLGSPGRHSQYVERGGEVRDIIAKAEQVDATWGWRSLDQPLDLFLPFLLTGHHTSCDEEAQVPIPIQQV